VSADKFRFDWLKAVYAGAFTDAHKAVLAYVAIFYVTHRKDTFSVRQTTIAERCGTSESTVRRAIARAKSNGYLAVSQQRQRGRTHQRANELRLTLPEIPVNLTSINDGNTGQNRPEYRSESTEIEVTANSSTSQNDTPISSVDSSGGSSEPPRYCPAHMPYGTVGRCYDCGTARVTRDAWKQSVKQRRAEARRKAIDNCPRCDENGMRPARHGLTRCECNQTQQQGAA
jgi:hypothetical protein